MPDKLSTTSKATLIDYIELEILFVRKKEKKPKTSKPDKQKNHCVDGT